MLLCTGRFPAWRFRTPFIEPQHVVDHFAEGLAAGAGSVGVLLARKLVATAIDLLLA